MKRKVRPNVVSGGTAINLGNNLYYMRGKTHKQGGIDIGSNPKTGIEVENGEVVQTSPKGLRVFSAQPILNGISPANALLMGGNPNNIFNAQEAWKQANHYNDDGTKFKDGGYTPSQEIIDYIKKTEGFRDKWYKDGNGIDTIGYGFTGSRIKKLYPNGITREQADKEFADSITKRALILAKDTPNWDKLSQSQRDALLSYHYNVGEGSYRNNHPKLQQALTDSDWEAVMLNMDAGYNDKKNPGLRTRRDYERELFRSGMIASLTGDEEKAFRDWYDRYSRSQNLDPNPDAKEHYYDYRTYWKNRTPEQMNDEWKLGNHLPDTYKKPGHPTFSTESIYSTRRTPGGTWKKVGLGPVYDEQFVDSKYTKNLRKYQNVSFALGGDNLKQNGYIEPSVVTAPLPKKFKGSQAAARRYAEGYQFGKQIAKERDKTAPYILAAANAPMLIEGLAVAPLATLASIAGGHIGGEIGYKVGGDLGGAIGGFVGGGIGGGLGAGARAGIKAGIKPIIKYGNGVLDRTAEALIRLGDNAHSLNEVGAQFLNKNTLKYIFNPKAKDLAYKMPYKYSGQSTAFTDAFPGDVVDQFLGKIKVPNATYDLSVLPKGMRDYIYKNYPNKKIPIRNLGKVSKRNFVIDIDDELMKQFKTEKTINTGGQGIIEDLYGNKLLDAGGFNAVIERTEPVNNYGFTQANLKGTDIWKFNPKDYSKRYNFDITDLMKRLGLKFIDSRGTPIVHTFESEYPIRTGRIIEKYGGDDKENNKFAIRDNTRTRFAPTIGYVPNAKLNKNTGKDVQYDAGPLGFVPYVGDILQGGQAVSDFNNGNYERAALNAGLLFLPNVIEKLGKPIIKTGIKAIKRSKYTFKENKELIKQFNDFAKKYGYPEIKIHPNHTKEINKQVIETLHRHNTFLRGVYMPTNEKELKILRKTLPNASDEQILEYIATNPYRTANGVQYVSPYKNAVIYGSHGNNGKTFFVERPFKLGADRTKWIEEASFPIYATGSHINADRAINEGFIKKGDVIFPWRTDVSGHENEFLIKGQLKSRGVAYDNKKFNKLFELEYGSPEYNKLYEEEQRVINSLENKTSRLILNANDSERITDYLYRHKNKYGGIHIKPSKRGTFTAAAKRHNMSVQEFARKVLNNRARYSAAMIKKANFARNASKWHKKELGGDMTKQYYITKDNIYSFGGSPKRKAPLGTKYTVDENGRIVPINIPNTDINIGEIHRLLDPVTVTNIVNPITSPRDSALNKPDFNSTVLAAFPNPDYNPGIGAIKEKSSTGNTPKNPYYSTLNVGLHRAGNYIRNNPDLLGLGINLTGNLAASLINRSAIKGMRYVDAPIPISAQKLPTEVNIEPQLSSVRENIAGQEKLIADNTADSRVALARRQRVRNQGTQQYQTLFGNKLNTELQLLTADRLNRQGVDAQNVTQYNQWRRGLYDFENRRREMLAENSVAGINNAAEAIAGERGYLARREARRQNLLNMGLIAAISPNAQNVIGSKEFEEFLRKIGYDGNFSLLRKRING